MFHFYTPCKRQKNQCFSDFQGVQKKTRIMMEMFWNIKILKQRGALFTNMFCTIWYHLDNLENVKNTHGRVLLLVKLQTEM